MKRLLFCPISIVLVLGALTAPAWTQQDTANVVSADCSGPIPREKLDTCLERVRVIDETDPSAPLKPLEAALEQRARHPEEASVAMPSGAAPDQGQQPIDASNQPPQEAHPDQQPANLVPYDQMQNARDATPSPSDQTGDAIAPDDNPQGASLDNTPDDSATQGPPQ